MTPERPAELQQAVGIAPGAFSERLAATGPDARAVYGALLPAFAASGRPPGPDALAAGTGLALGTVRAALAELAADLVARGPDGDVLGAFPLSAVPTRHRVQVPGRPVLHAMLGVAGTVIRADPATGQQIKQVLLGPGARGAVLSVVAVHGLGGLLFGSLPGVR